MAYTKTNWINNTTELNAQNMNHIEDGIENAYGHQLLAVADEAPAECVEGDQYYNKTTAKIYTATGTNTWGTDGEDPEEDVFYVVMETQNIFTYNGQELISVGGGAGGQIAISETEPTEDEILWINPEDTPSGSLNPITNTYSEATDKGYSCDYLNNSDSYSTSEIKTNKRWIDGKPIYRRNLIVNTGTTLDLWHSIAHNINNVDFIMIINAFFVNGNGDKEMLPNSDTQVAINSSNILLVLKNASMQNRTMTLIVEYTKTTD